LVGFGSVPIFLCCGLNEEPFLVSWWRDGIDNGVRQCFVPTSGSLDIAHLMGEKVRSEYSSSMKKAGNFLENNTTYQSKFNSKYNILPIPPYCVDVLKTSKCYKKWGNPIITDTFMKLYT
jgi:hypothetical protein